MTTLWERRAALHHEQLAAHVSAYDPTATQALNGLAAQGLDTLGGLAVLVGAACLIQDFDQAKVGVEMGAPAKYAWSCAFGLMVTVVWMYIEILQLLARLRDN